jgi:hypothetical protein
MTKILFINGRSFLNGLGHKDKTRQKGEIQKGTRQKGSGRYMDTK